MDEDIFYCIPVTRPEIFEFGVTRYLTNITGPHWAHWTSTELTGLLNRPRGMVTGDTFKRYAYTAITAVADVGLT